MGVRLQRAVPRPLRRWVSPVARLGFAAKGAVYIAVGIVAARAAVGWGGRPAGPSGAIRTIGRQPLGSAIAGLVALGLLAYAVWRFVQAIADVDGKGSDWKGLATRAGYLVSGAMHAALSATATNIAFGYAGRRSDTVREWTAWVLDDPRGWWLVGLAGLGVMGYGLHQFRISWKLKFLDRLRTREMSPAQERWAVRVGRFGVAARGAVFEVVGWFLIRAAAHGNPSEARDMAGALSTLRQQAYGHWLLGLVAAGLVAYGVHELVTARYRQIRA